jgi:hypothetical protein
MRKGGIPTPILMEFTIIVDLGDAINSASFHFDNLGVLVWPVVEKRRFPSYDNLLVTLCTMLSHLNVILA